MDNPCRLVNPSVLRNFPVWQPRERDGSTSTTRKRRTSYFKELDPQVGTACRLFLNTGLRPPYELLMAEKAHVNLSDKGVHYKFTKRDGEHLDGKHVIIPPRNSESILLSLPVENQLKMKSGSSARGFYGCVQHIEYETPNGEILSYSAIPYASSTHANKNLQRSLKDALQIIERAPKLDWNKRKVGERVVAEFQSDGNGKQEFGILWTDKSVLRIVRASTSELALDYEQKEARRNRSF
jgi:hypothetical protein